jgi:hypothetical protein
MKKTITLIFTSLLLMTFPLSACAGNQFPTGLFQHDLIRDFFFEINKDGTWTYYLDTMVVASGTYSIRGNEFIVETDQVNPSINPDAATYIWSYNNDILMLQLKGENTPPECFHNFSEEARERKLNPPTILNI